MSENMLTMCEGEVKAMRDASRALSDAESSIFNLVAAISVLRDAICREGDDVSAQMVGEDTRIGFGVIFDALREKYHTEASNVNRARVRLDGVISGEMRGASTKAAA